VRVGALATAVVLAGCGSSAPAQTEWPHTDPVGRFSVVFPNEFDTYTTKAGEGDAERAVTSATASKGSDQFGVIYSDVPKSFLAAGDLAVLVKARDTAIEGIKGTLVSSEETTFDSHVALDVIATSDAASMKGEYHARYILVGTRIYELLVIRKEPKADDTRMRDFFDSFELTGS
jgi:hypothetical protein